MQKFDEIAKRLSWEFWEYPLSVKTQNIGSDLMVQIGKNEESMVYTQLWCDASLRETEVTAQSNKFEDYPKSI